MQSAPESATVWLVLGKTVTSMTERNNTSLSGRSGAGADALPYDIDALRALILAERAAHASAHATVVAERNNIAVERDQFAARTARLEEILAEIRRAHFGRKSERINDDQLALALEELETSLGKAEAEDEKA
jgi:hypothetical protein